MPTPKSKSSSNKRKTTLKSALKKHKTSGKTKKVRIHSSENKVRIFHENSDEKRLKKVSSPKKGIECGQGVYPCVYRGVTFENEKEWRNYSDNRITRNASTGHRAVHAHKQTTLRELARKGKSAKRIPEEFRLYNVQTGEIFDMRDLDPKAMTYKPLK